MRALSTRGRHDQRIPFAPCHNIAVNRRHRRIRRGIRRRNRQVERCQSGARQRSNATCLQSNSRIQRIGGQRWSLDPFKRNPGKTQIHCGNLRILKEGFRHLPRKKLTWGSLANRGGAQIHFRDLITDFNTLSRERRSTGNRIRDRRFDCLARPSDQT